MSDLRILEMLDESGLAVEEMNGIVDLLSPLSQPEEQAPAPSSELAALFGPQSGRPVTRVGRRHGAVAGALVLALSGVGATGLSAAANTLPGPLQHRVSQFSHHYLPFDLPEPPAGRHGALGVTPLPPTTDRDGLAASRSTPGREAAEDAATAPQQADRRPSSRPSAEPTAQSSDAYGPSAAPTYGSQSAEPSPSEPADTAGSATPTDRPAHVRGPGHSGHEPKPEETKNTGQNGNADTAQKPGNGHQGKSNGTGNQGNDNQGAGNQGTGNQGTGNNGNGSQPGSGPGDPGPAAPPATPAPVPDPSAPGFPLPDPLSGLGPVGNAAGGLVPPNGD